MKVTRFFAILGVIVAYLLVGGTEAYLHWYAGTQNTSSAHSWKEWYSEEDPQNGKLYHSSYVDLIFPAILLGLASGFVTARQPQRVLVWSVFLLCLGMVGLFPLYAALTPTKASDEWWTFAPNIVRAMAFVPGYFKAVLFCLFFGGVARAVTQESRNIIPDF